MNIYDLKRQEAELLSKLAACKANLEWLVADSEQNYQSPNTEVQEKFFSPEPSKDFHIPKAKQQSLLNLTPEEFAERYQKDGQRFADKFYAELIKAAEPPKIEQPTQSYTFINVPPKYSADEVFKRVKNGEDIIQILNQVTETE